MPKKLDIDTQNINPLLANCLTLLRSLLDALHGHQRISRLSNTADPEAYSLISYPLSPHSHFPFCRVDISASAPGGQQPEHGNLTLSHVSSRAHNPHSFTIAINALCFSSASEGGRDNYVHMPVCCYRSRYLRCSSVGTRVALRR